MRLIEVVEGADTSDETVQATTAFVAQIRKTPIRCGEAPGFVVNRILNSATSEVWRMVDEEGISFEDADAAIKDSGVAPVGPFHLVDLLGLDTVLHVAEHLHESYGDRFYVSKAMRERVAAGDLGVKTGKGFYEHG
jgi:3-hydroxyacyl-CoA dehydrogenase